MNSNYIFYLLFIIFFLVIINKNNYEKFMREGLKMKKILTKKVKIYFNTDNNKKKKIIQQENFVLYLKKNLNYNVIDNNSNSVFLNHNEYIMKNYFFYLKFYNNQNIIDFVENENNSDYIVNNIGRQNISFKNTKTSKIIKFGIESTFVIPYFTGIYTNNKQNQSYNNSDKKIYLISYIGGIWRGPKINGKNRREITINKLKKLDNKSKDNIFYNPLLAENHNQERQIGWNKGVFGIQAKKTYLNSYFSWQPYGDTPTRRGFYEALLLGNIPVISKKSYNLYKKLYIGEDILKKICIILEEDKFYDADFLIKYLKSVNIKEYSKNIEIYASRLQWNVDSKNNALVDIHHILFNNL